MSAVVLVRHAMHERVDAVLCGRMPGVTLGARGRDEAGALADRLRGSGAALVLTSPLERARQTAAPIAAALGLRPEVTPELNEIDFGDWTGRSFATLASDPLWHVWNEARSTALPPRGEGMAAVQARVAGLLARLENQDGTAILVSHCDVIRTAVLSVLGLSLDAYARFDIDPASITTLALWPGGGEVTGKITGMNERVGTGATSAKGEVRA